jgi:long-chain acyl-CoA synthetase
MKTIEEIYTFLSADNNATKPFVTFEKNVLTYGELNRRLNKISGLFDEKKLTNRSRLMICSNSDEVVITFTIAALLNGITSVVLSSDTKTMRATSTIELVQPNLLVVDNDLVAQWGLDKSNLFLVRQSSDERSGNNLLAKLIRGNRHPDWVDDLNAFVSLEPLGIESHTQIALIKFTSGTTNRPKGVQISYHNLFTHLETFGKKFGYDSHSRILNNLPLAHADGSIQGYILALYFGARLYRPTNLEIQQLEPYLNTIYRERITHAISVPTVWSLVDRLTTHNDYFEGEDFKYPISVAGVFDSGLWERLERRFQIKWCNIYGLTETVLGGLFCGPDTESYRHGSVGKPLDMEMIIVDSDGNPVESGEVGELWLRGENVFPGYFNDDRATTEVFRGNWFCTGDLARQDLDGFVYICGRKKETIISGGLNIQPNEVNEVLLRQESVFEAATIGIPDPDWGEIVVSVVVCRSGVSISEVDLIELCRESLEHHKVPRQIVFVDSLPKGDAGKVQLPQLKQTIRDRNEISKSGELTQESFFKLVAEVFQLDGKMLSLSDRSDQLPGWDSLGHLSLILSLEKATGIDFSPQEIMSINSLNDIWEIVNRGYR